MQVSPWRFNFRSFVITTRSLPSSLSLFSAAAAVPARLIANFIAIVASTQSPRAAAGGAKRLTELHRGTHQRGSERRGGPSRPSTSRQKCSRPRNGRPISLLQRCGVTASRRLSGSTTTPRATGAGSSPPAASSPTSSPRGSSSASEYYR